MRLFLVSALLSLAACSPTVDPDPQWMVGTFSDIAGREDYADSFSGIKLVLRSDGSGDYVELSCATETRGAFDWTEKEGLVRMTPLPGRQYFGKDDASGPFKMTLARQTTCDEDGRAEYPVEYFRIPAEPDSVVRATVLRTNPSLILPPPQDDPPCPGHDECSGPEVCLLELCDGCEPELCDE